MSWYLEQGKDDDVVVSTRVRLARNLSDTDFPWRLDKGEANHLIDRISEAFATIAEADGRDVLNVRLDSLDEVNKLALSEKRLISRNMLTDDLPRSLLLFSDESSGVLVNEEDHLRIQTMRAGMALNEALSESTVLAEQFESILPLAYDSKLGYLTTCPTNTGTGLRVSVMLHVPLLIRSKLISRLKNSLAKAGYAIRGSDGEGSEATCDMIQISNQVTLGFNESEIVAGLNQLSKELIEQERKYRQLALEENALTLEDQIYRAHGLLSSARTISFAEAMSLLSALRLGIALNIIEDVDLTDWQRLFIETGAGSIQSRAGEELPQWQIDKQRADYIRKIINKNKQY